MVKGMRRISVATCVIAILVLAAVLGKMPSTREWFDQHRVPSKGRRILVLYTGGTIGMQKGPQGYRPRKGYFGRQLQRILQLHAKSNEDLAHYDLLEFSPLIDSSNAGTKDWNKMAATVADHYDAYDAFIVVHGTDTMAYSASALSFALDGLQKPVIFTGSQIPLARLRNDGQNNVIAALQLASHYNIPEVLLVFNGAIMRGNRTVKVSSNRLRAFACPNYPDLGAFGYALAPTLRWDLIKPPRGNGLTLFPFTSEARVSTLFLAPGLDYGDALSKLIGCGSPPRGLIIRTYGIGDGPAGNGRFVALLADLKRRGIVVLSISQCLQGRVDQDDYQTGKRLEAHGVISGQDMTFEAGYAKMCYLLSRYPEQPQVVRQYLVADLHGELGRSLSVLDVDPRVG